jgi:large subunit ribosomal protein L18
MKGVEQMIKKISGNVSRLSRHERVRKNISGTAQRPRLCVFRSLKNIYAQIIDDASGTTLVSASSIEAAFEGNGSNKEAAKKVGLMVAQKALDKGIKAVVFDRGGYIYHGRVQELAEGAREGGLEF